MSAEVPAAPSLRPCEFWSSLCSHLTHTPHQRGLSCLLGALVCPQRTAALGSSAPINPVVKAAAARPGGCSAPPSSGFSTGGPATVPKPHSSLSEGLWGLARQSHSGKPSLLACNVNKPAVQAVKSEMKGEASGPAAAERCFLFLRFLLGVKQCFISRCLDREPLSLQYQHSLMGRGRGSTPALGFLHQPLGLGLHHRQAWLLVKE